MKGKLTMVTRKEVRKQEKGKRKGLKITLAIISS